jgi:hypothetical protein
MGLFIREGQFASSNGFPGLIFSEEKLLALKNIITSPRKTLRLKGYIYLFNQKLCL